MPKFKRVIGASTVIFVPGLTLLVVIGALLSATALGQTLNPSSPAREFVHFGDRLVAVVAPVNPVPVAVGVTPANGTGQRQVFAYTASDASGFQDIVTLQVVVNAVLTPTNSCYLYIARSTRMLYLMNDANTAWLGPFQAGTAGTMQNTQCIVYAQTSSFSESGNNVTVSIDIQFKPAFQGAHNNWLYAIDQQSQETGWVDVGNWTVP